MSGRGGGEEQEVHLRTCVYHENDKDKDPKRCGVNRYGGVVTLLWKRFCCFFFFFFFCLS